MQSIKMYKDGSRLTLVIDGCTPEINTLIGNLVSNAIGEKVEPTEVKGIEPATMPKEEKPEIKGTEVSPIAMNNLFTFKYGKVSGMTVDESVNKYPLYLISLGLKNIGNTKVNDYEEALKEAFVKVVNKLDEIPEDKLTKEYILNFITTLKYSLENPIKELMDNLGYAGTVDDFIKTEEDLDTLILCYNSLVNLLVQKSKTF